MAELTSRRTANTKHFRLADGSLQAHIYAGPVHYRDAAGKWQPIDTAWEDEPGFGRKVKKAAAHLRIHGEAGNVLRVGLAPGAYVDYTLPGAPAVDGSVATLADAWAKSDLRYTAGPAGVKGEIILREAGHPAAFAFPAALTGCTAFEDAGGLGLYADKNRIGAIPDPFAVDANGSRGPVAMAWDGESITLTPDPAWLATAAYPVTVDPTTNISPPTGDAYVYSANPTGNYGSDAELIVQPGDVYYSLVKFDLSSLAASTISAATLKLNVGGASGSGGNATVQRVTSNWAEGTVTWATGPTVDGVTWATSAIGAAGSWTEFNVLTLVQAWVAGTYTNHGFYMLGDLASGAGFRSWYSKEGLTSPVLAVTYNAWPTTTLTYPTGTSGSPTGVNDDVTPRVTWTYSDPESDAQSKYQVRVYDPDSNVYHDSGEVSSANAYYDVPLSAGLKYGVKYQVKARTNDGTSWGNWSTGTYMQFTLTAPTTLAAADDAAGAEIDLTWDAHAGENLAGYNVYRRTGSAAYAQINTALVVTNAYSDRLAVSGVAYDYQVTAVASDGYESAKSSTASDTVTYTKIMIDALEVYPPMSALPKFDRPRRASRRVATDGSYIIQDLGLLPRIGRFFLQYSSWAGRDAILAILTADHTFSYRSPDGETFAGKVTSDIGDDRYKTPVGGSFYGVLSFEATEVLP